MHDTPPNELELSTIAPGVAAKYSPNLWGYLRTIRAAARFATGFRDREDGTLWLGYIHDGDFVGTRLMRVLCEGARAEPGCVVGLARKLEPIANFWEGYARLGRCFIDPAHEQNFVDPRWREQGDQRFCLWCGHTQHKHHWQESVSREHWRSGGASEAVSA